MQIITAPAVRLHKCVVYVAHQHDEWPMFRIWFSILVVTASIVLNLGVFTLLVSLHMALDVVKYRGKYNLSWYWTVVETLRESLIDIFFIAFGLLLGIVFHHSVAIGGLGRMARLEYLFFNLILRVGPRLKIAEHLLEIFLYWKHHFEKQFVPHEPLSRSEKSILGATLVLTAGILLTPIITPLTYKDIGHTVAHELTPRLELGVTKTIDEIMPAEAH